MLCVVAQGRGAEAHNAVVLGQATVLAAVNTQAKVVPKVRVVAGAPPSESPTPTTVFFDRVVDADVLSLTAGALGAISVPLRGLILEERSVQDHALVSSGSGGHSDVRFVLHLELLKTTTAAASTASRGGAGASRVVPTLAPSKATSAASGAAAATTSEPAPIIETVVLRAPPPVPPPLPAVALETVPLVLPPPLPPPPEPLGPSLNSVATPAPCEAAPDAHASVRALVEAAVAAAPGLVSGPALPCRLVDYFAVMVSQEVPFDPTVDGSASVIGGGVGAAASSRRRRTGTIQYRYPKRNHVDCPLPDNVDWFAFPNGIEPMLQPTAAQSRPPIQHSVFVLSNVDGGGALGGRMYGCCLTAFRKEIEDRVSDDGDGAGSTAVDASGVTVRF